MKLIKGILGCALAAGLTTFASVQAQAGTVIDGTLFSTVNLKLVVNYENTKGKVSKKTVTSKQVLKDLGYNSNVALAVANDFEEDSGIQFYVINTKSQTVIEFLTEEGTMSITNLNSVIETEKEGKNSIKETSVGTLGILFTTDSDTENDVETFDNFDVSGIYSATLTGKEAKNDTEKSTVSVKVSSLSGSGFFSEIPDQDDENAVVTGSATVKGSGNVDFEDIGF
jgi:hypothetical protein